MRKGKKVLAIAMTALMMIGSLAGCGSSDDSNKGASTSGGTQSESSDSERKVGGELVVYSACNEDILETVIPMFEEKTGVKVELLTGGAGELLKRVESESANPYCDVVFGGTESQYYEYIDQFQEYVSPNDEYMLDGHHSYQNKLTPINMDSAVIMWNTNLIGDIKITSYEDLLQPELKGKIALPDPASSGTGSGTIVDFVWLFNGESWDGEAGWEKVREFAKQLDGKISGSSGNAHKSVADGENTVTVTYEGAAFAYLKNGADVDICYPSEGVISANAMMGIVKDCANLDNAKEFTDFITSKEVQDLFGTELMSRPVRADAELADFIPDASTIKYFERSQEERAKRQPEIIERFNEIFAEVQE